MTQDQITRDRAATPDDSATVVGSHPYPWPWDGAVDPSTLAILVVQTPESTPVPAGPLDAIGTLAERVQRAGGSVIHLVSHPPVRRWAGRGVADFAASPPFVAGPRADAVVHAAGWNGFFESTLDSALRQRGLTHLLMTGYWLEVGVHSTMRAANDMGYECLLVDDAVVAADPSLTAASLSSIEMSGGIFGAVGSSTAVIAAIDVATRTAHPA